MLIRILVAFSNAKVCGVTQSDFRHIAQELINLSNTNPEEDYEVDHIIPISQSGCNCPENLQVLTTAAMRHFLSSKEKPSQHKEK